MSERRKSFHAWSFKDDSFLKWFISSTDHTVSACGYGPLFYGTRERKRPPSNRCPSEHPDCCRLVGSHWGTSSWRMTCWLDGSTVSTLSLPRRVLRMRDSDEYPVPVEPWRRGCWGCIAARPSSSRPSSQRWSRLSDQRWWSRWTARCRMFRTDRQSYRSTNWNKEIDKWCIMGLSVIWSVRLN